MDKEFSHNIVEQLAKSDIYKEYEKAFREATHLPLALRTVEDEFDPGTEGHAPFGNPFCEHLKNNHSVCDNCRDIQEQLSSFSDSSVNSVVCFTGLTESAVPVYLNNDAIAYLQTGQVFLKPVDEQDEESMEDNLLRIGVRIEDNPELKELYYKTRVMTPKRYEAILKLLEIFARDLSEVITEMVIREGEKEPPRIKKAKRYIREHLDDDLSLDEVATSVNWSAYYFSRMFKKATGLNFVDYVARVRIDHAKKLLQNPHLNVSEIAYEVGFQSITHFNRVFRKLTGTSPTDFRKQTNATS